MLSRSHGAYMLANLSQNSKKSTISLSSHMLRDKMKSTISTWTRRALTPKTSTTPSSADPRLWQPQNGISFDTGSSSRKMSSLQDLAMTADPIEQEIISYPNSNFPKDSDPIQQPIDAGLRVPLPRDAKKVNGKSVASTEDAWIDKKVAESGEEDSEHTPLSFQMTPKLYEEAQNATPGTPGSYWSHSLYRRPAKPGTSKTEDEKVLVHYCKSKETTERVAQYFKNDKVIGFDIEWSVPLKAGPKNNVSLIQIANDERIALFHIALYAKNEIDDLVAPTLKKILEDANITKVGVNIKGDCTRLRKHLNINCEGIFELSHLYKLVRYSLSGETKLINKKPVALQIQVEEHLKLPMFKGDDVRSSDWAKSLNMSQIKYAASDSYAGLRLFDTLEQQRKQLIPIPPRPYHAELNLPIRLADGIMIETAEELMEEQIEVSETQPQDPSNTNNTSTIITTTATLQTTTITTTTKPSPKPKEKAATSPEALAAENWVTAWKNSLPKVHVVRATNRSLQAYALWHAQKFGVGEVAALLREQPLADSTVRNYILDAVQTECLDFDRTRMKELVGAMDATALTRYRRVVGQLGL